MYERTSDTLNIHVQDLDAFGVRCLQDSIHVEAGKLHCLTI